MFPNYNNQKEGNISPSKLSRKWKTNLWFALHRKLATPAVLLDDFCRDWPFVTWSRAENLPCSLGLGRMVVWECCLLLGVMCMCELKVVVLTRQGTTSWSTFRTLLACFVLVKLPTPQCRTPGDKTKRIGGGGDRQLLKEAKATGVMKNGPKLG